MGPLIIQLVHGSTSYDVQGEGVKGKAVHDVLCLHLREA